MLIWIVSLLLAALCGLVASSKGYSTVLAAVGGFIGGFPGGVVLLIVLILLPDRAADHTDLSAKIVDCCREIDALKQRIAELEAAQPNSKVETPAPTECVPASQEEEIPLTDDTARFPTRVKTEIHCPRCKARQPGNRNVCYSCGLHFTYEDE